MRGTQSVAAVSRSATHVTPQPGFYSHTHFHSTPATTYSDLRLLFPHTSLSHGEIVAPRMFRYSLFHRLTPTLPHPHQLRSWLPFSSYQLQFGPSLRKPVFISLGTGEATTLVSSPTSTASGGTSSHCVDSAMNLLRGLVTSFPIGCREGPCQGVHHDWLPRGSMPECLPPTTCGNGRSSRPLSPAQWGPHINPSHISPKTHSLAGAKTKGISNYSSYMKYCLFTEIILAIGLVKD